MSISEIYVSGDLEDVKVLLVGLSVECPTKNRCDACPVKNKTIKDILKMTDEEIRNIGFYHARLCVNHE